MLRLDPPLPPLTSWKERSALPLNQQRDEKNSWCPLGPGQGLGCGPPGQGGTIIRIRPLPRDVDWEGGLSTRSFFVPKFCYIPDNLAAERTEKEVRITQFNYIYIFDCCAMGCNFAGNCQRWHCCRAKIAATGGGAGPWGSLPL